MNVLLIFLGGGTGSVIRFFIAYLFSKTSLTLPFATLTSNVISCLLFALVLSVFGSKQVVPDTYKSLIIIGICGGLSTFSTFSFETFELVKLGMTGWAVANILISCALCMSLFFLFSK
ncbi:MAG: fluoride efflux transporter CrcB [Bacteroidota bacterium]